MFDINGNFSFDLMSSQTWIISLYSTFELLIYVHVSISQVTMSLILLILTFDSTDALFFDDAKRKRLRMCTYLFVIYQRTWSLYICLYVLDEIILTCLFVGKILIQHSSYA